MKQFYLTLSIVTLFFQVQAQSFSMDDLVSLTHFPSARFDNYLAKKGYRAAGSSAGTDSLAYTYFNKKGKDEQPEKQILKVGKENTAVVAYQTTEKTEYDRLSEQLKANGYRFTHDLSGQGLYQKGSVTITTRQERGDKTLYSFIVENKPLPRPRDILYAEDFLQLASHEYLVAVFGEGNVKKDVFYFSENEVNKCSVLFPNTNMQVIFIWHDQVSNRGIDFLLIGGHLRAESSIDYHKQVELNAWQSRLGIWSGMSLQELQDINGSNLSIFGWNTEQPGVVSPKNKGKINFKNLGIVLNCLDCNEDRYYSKSNLINSADLLAQGRRVYVSTIIILPEKHQE